MCRPEKEKEVRGEKSKWRLLSYAVRRVHEESELERLVFGVVGGGGVSIFSADAKPYSGLDETVDRTVKIKGSNPLDEETDSKQSALGGGGKKRKMEQGKTPLSQGKGKKDWRVLKNSCSKGASKRNVGTAWVISLKRGMVGRAQGLPSFWSIRSMKLE